MQQTICARVSEKLLTKAQRLFTGTIDGRVIEILQNARRATATEVRITNRDGFVTVEDNGRGIDDFQKLLDLGGSGWDEKLEAGEDPAGVGLFSLAPREVEIASGNRKIVIDKDGWTGKPVEVTKTSEKVAGTILKFRDEKPWDMALVEKHAVFAGIRVIVEGKYCHQMPFCGGEAVHYDNPGCKIEVADEISNYHSQWTSSWYHGRVLVNFHGQVVQLDYWPSRNRHSLVILVDIADQTDIRLMLPARTMLVENDAFEQMKKAIELEYYKYFQRQKTHCLYYKEYLRAKELGIELPEAAPQYKVGVLWGEYNEPVEIAVPTNFKLEDGYLCFEEDFKDETSQANVHLLSALGDFKEKPFVPVTIDKGYTGYSWSNLPKVTKLEVIKGKEKLRHQINCNEIACFDKLAITVHTSDGKIFSSEVEMAVVTELPKGKYQWSQQTVCVTKDARDYLSSENIWFHLGGYSDEGDSFDTQLYYFEKELNEFWHQLVGPYESLRSELFSALSDHYDLCDKWQKITMLTDESIEIVFKNGKKERVNPPSA
ncbi:MAG: ATP-binding protein [Phycisphaerae bacterium]|nr:ATP-binding protein [Phycisphaerae bacterium]